MKDWHPVRFHLNDKQIKESDEALEEIGGKRGTFAKAVYLRSIAELLAEKRTARAKKTRS